MDFGDGLRGETERWTGGRGRIGALTRNGFWASGAALCEELWIAVRTVDFVVLGGEFLACQLVVAIRTQEAFFVPRLALVRYSALVYHLGHRIGQMLIVLHKIWFEFRLMNSFRELVLFKSAPKSASKEIWIKNSLFSNQTSFVNSKRAERRLIPGLNSKITNAVHSLIGIQCFQFCWSHWSMRHKT